MTALCGAAILCTLPVQAGSDDVTTAAVKRYFLAEANARCHLLDGPAAVAVTAGYLQARNSVIRMNGSMTSLTPWLAKARETAQALDCDAPQLRAEAFAAANAYGAFASRPSLTLTGTRSQWTAKRSHGDQQDWRLAQYLSTDEAHLVLGLYGTLENNSFVVMAGFQGDEKPYAARLIVRDTETAPAGVIGGASHGLSRTVPLGFASGVKDFPARASATVTAALTPQVKANMLGVSAAGDYVGTQGPVEALRFDFPSRAWRAIAPLDPREDIVVAFDFRDGTRYARFEVGDFIAGLGYVRLPSVYGGKIG